MKRILLAVLGVIVVAVIAVLAMAATRPDTFHVERSATITAAPATVFAMVDDFRRWPEWSPWEKLDPDMQRTLSGSPSGQDAVYAWAGDSKAGEGRMTITESQPYSRIGIRLEFLKPWQSTSQVGFAFTPVGDATEVTWTMDGKYQYMEKVMCVFMDMDKMVGKDFETGLASMQHVAENTLPPIPPDSTVLERTTTVPGDTMAAPAGR